MSSSNSHLKLRKYWNIYEDPSDEIDQLTPVLISLDERIQSLLSEWPSNGILLQIDGMIQLISKFDANSAFIRYLNAVEILMLKCHEWETYAASKYSLKAELAKLTQLIIQWRKMELRSWSKLLGSLEEKCDEEVSEIWFYLYQILVQDTRSAMNDTAKVC
jgi:midasin